ncbi:MAG: maleylpyruvate isomerase N-terminal domain-containing protein [Planctomycetes bacterium]|nr:maleylpyruvate isomerase N-terminal domain-containing protein [Planctomycetota bacterium]
MKTMPPILVAGLFPEMSRQLVKLLRSLTPDEWHFPTFSSRRLVKDIASHLLDGSLRRLSMQRDGYFSADGSSKARAGETTVDFLSRLNDEWEIATRRLSPQVLIELIEWADAQLAELFRSLDPQGPAIFPVAWAGEEKSENWMDIARDYTEKWHHTQQIFAATGRPSTIMNRELGYPCFDIFMRALRYTFRNVEADQGSVVAVAIKGEAGGTWYIERRKEGWEQIAVAPGPPTATVTMDQDTAWQVVTKRRSPEAIRQQFSDIRITGDETLGLSALNMVSVMA